MGVSRNVRLATIVCTALLLVLASSFAATAAPKKPFRGEITPHQVNEGSTTTYTLTVKNEALTQQLGSCNLTAPPGFTIVSDPTQPSTGSATRVGNLIKLRNLSTLPMQERSTSFDAQAPFPPDPPFTYTWAIVCRQANNFAPDAPSNQFALSEGSNMKTTVISPLPDADVAVTGNTESQDPVTASNTVVYTVTVHNNGPSSSGALTLTDSLPNGGSITSIDGGPNWTCGGSGGSASCTHAALASGADAEPVTVNVLTPDQDTVITNRASIGQSGADDPAPANNTLDQTTTVNANTTCPSGQVSCGSGTIVYSQGSSVRSCAAPTMLVYICGLVTFDPVEAGGNQIYSLNSPQTPENLCPISLTNSTVVRCDWQVNLDPIPLQFPTGKTTATFTCHGSKCPAGLGDAGTIVVYVGQSGTRELLQQCSGPSDTSKCWTRARVGGNLVITVRNMPPGDPKIAGRCIAGC